MAIITMDFIKLLNQEITEQDRVSIQKALI